MAATTAPAAPAAAADTRSRRARMLRPFAVAAGALAGLGVVYAIDPNQPGHYPLCPFRLLTGWDCPGCGATRGMHDLVHGDVAGALDHNVLLALAVPAAVLVWFGWARRSWTGSARRRELPRAAVVALVVVLVVFWVVRNLPGVPYLGSG